MDIFPGIKNKNRKSVYLKYFYNASLRVIIVLILLPYKFVARIYAFVYVVLFNFLSLKKFPTAGATAILRQFISQDRKIWRFMFIVIIHTRNAVELIYLFFCFCFIFRT